MALGLRRSGQWGLDIGGSSLTALNLSGKTGHMRLGDCLDWPLPEGIVVDGEVAEPDLFTRELRAFANRYKLRGRSVQLAVSNQKVIVRNIDVPDMSEGELRGAIEYQAQDYIPIPVEEVVLDFQVVGKHQSPDGATRQEVLLVAAQKTMISTLLSAVRQAGLKVSGIDVSSLALVRALIPAPTFLDGSDEAPSCCGIADISSSVSTLVVAVSGVLKFTRIINFSSDRFLKALSDEQHLPFGDTQPMVQRIGLAGPLAADDDVYTSTVVNATQETLAKVAAELSDEIRRSFDYYQGQEHAIPVNELILSGRGALVRNLDSHLQDALDMPVSLGNPLGRVGHNGSDVPDETLASMAPYLAVAVGLALPEDD